MLKEILLVLFSVIGLAVSYTIWRKTVQKKGKLVCIMGDGGCDKVVKSKYGHLFGVDNSTLGILYYLLILAVVIAGFVYPAVSSIAYFTLGIKIMAGASAAMSVVLTFIQFKVIKQVCEYCMTANMVNVAIFIVVMIL